MTTNARDDVSTAGRDAYYILYYSERLCSGTLGPLKRARYATAAEAVDQAHALRHSPNHSPLEVRDQRDRLVTCAMMGWRMAPLHRTVEAGIRAIA